MNREPRYEGDYSRRQVAAARRVLVDVGQVLASFHDAKDVYDLCYCLDAYPGGITALAADWRARQNEPIVRMAIGILRTKFETVNHYGPQQLAVFHGRPDDDEGAMHARRAFELVQALLALL